MLDGRHPADHTDVLAAAYTCAVLCGHNLINVLVTQSCPSAAGTRVMSDTTKLYKSASPGTWLCSKLAGPPLCEQVLVSGLDDTSAAVPSDPAECFAAAEALIPGRVPQPKPGEAQVISLMAC